MNEEIQTEIAGDKQGEHRTKRIICWGARITSIPILALILTSLLPSLTNFAVSAPDDKLITIGLCCTFAGLLVGWRYARAGGLLALAGVVLMLTQGDNPLYPDPFSLAFGIQAILFLAAGTLVASKPTGSPGFAWATKGMVVLFAVLAGVAVFTILRGPGPTPVPKENGSFVGQWASASGLTLEINPDGFAKVGLPKNAHVEGLSLPVVEGETNTFMAYFHDTDLLELNRGLLWPSRTYRIDRRPHAEGNQVRCTLRNEESKDKTSAVTLTKNSGS
jgi:hypothetical protein